MQLKEDELLIIGLIDETTIEGRVSLKEVRSVYFDLLQIGPMFRTFLSELEAQKNLRVPEDRIDKVDLLYSDVFDILRSVSYQKEVPKVSCRKVDPVGADMLGTRCSMYVTAL